MSNIVMLLLTNGDEVFGKVKHENDRGIDLDDALIITYTNIDGTPNLIFRKYCTFTNNYDIFFKREHIVAKFTDIREEILKSYEMTLGVYTEHGLPNFHSKDDDYMTEFEFDDDVDDIDDGFFIDNISKKVH